MRAGVELVDSHLDFRAAAIKVFMDDYEGLDFSSWSRRIIRERTGSEPSEDFRQVEELIRETSGLSMKLSGGFSNFDALEAHQDTKMAFHDLRDVALRGWKKAKELLKESSSGEAIVTAVEALARLLGRERRFQEQTLESKPKDSTKEATHVPAPSPTKTYEMDRPRTSQCSIKP